MLNSKYFLLLPAIALSVVTSPLTAAQQHEHFHRTLPADKVNEIRALKNPLPQSPETLAEGKKIYNGKGGCANCHGPQGGGDGPMAADLDPPPRNFQHGQFWSHHTEGELFWVIKHGAQGTAMPAYEGILTDEEIWAVMRFLPTFAKEGEGSHHPRGHSKKHGHGHGHGHSREQGEGEESDIPGHGHRHQGHQTHD